MTSPNGFHSVEEGVSLTADWTLSQAQAFYAEMARRLSAVMTILDTIPITEMIAVNARLSSVGMLSLPPEVTPQQAQAWAANLQRDKKTFELLQQVLTHIKTP